MSHLKLSLKKLITKTLILKFNIFKIIKVLISRIYLRYIARDLKIANWHLNATFDARKYKLKVLKIYEIFDVDIDNIIEIGCGSGDLISRLNSKNKFGIDIEESVLELCNRLHPNIETICLDVIDDFEKLKNQIKSLKPFSTTFIIMVNWLHEYSSKEVNLLMDNILSIDKKIIILADIYSRSEFSKNHNNKIKHDFSSLKKLKWSLYFGDIDEVRDINILSNFNPKAKIK